MLLFLSLKSIFNKAELAITIYKSVCSFLYFTL